MSEKEKFISYHRDFEKDPEVRIESVTDRVGRVIVSEEGTLLEKIKITTEIVYHELLQYFNNEIT